MKILSFSGEKVHNYIDFSLKFNNDLSILIGSNGSGKTSAILLLQAILRLNFSDLINIPFSTLNLEIQTKKILNITVNKKRKNEISIQVSGIKKALILENKFCEELEFLKIKNKENFDIDTMISRSFCDNEVFSFIRNLTSPLFLNLERRNEYSSFDEDEFIVNRRNLLYMTRNSDKYSNPKRQFQGTLGESLLETQFLVQRLFKELSSFEKENNEKLKNEIILSSFEYISFDPDKLSDIEAKRKLVLKKQEIENAFRRIGDSDNKVLFEKLNTFFSQLERLLKDTEENDEKGNFRIEFLTNQFQIERLSKLTVLIDEINNQTKDKFLNFYNFIDMINSFLKESHKSISVDEVGHLIVKRPNGELVSIDSLSSGERQILIIFAKIILNRRKSNIVIIDEPELSLHIRWQERFIESILTSSLDTQFILATHSPDIVGDYKSKCIFMKEN